MTQAFAAHDTYLAAFERIAQRSDSWPIWLSERKREAIGRFERLGFPTTRDEEWRFTNVAPLASRAFVVAAEPASPSLSDIAPALLQGSTWRVVFVEGRYAPELSSVAGLPRNVQVGPLTDALAQDGSLIEPHLTRLAGFDDNAFTALNTAFFRDGAFVVIPGRCVLDRPLQLVFVSRAGTSETMSHPRTLVLAGPQSQARIVESYTSARSGICFTGPVTEVVVGEGAVVDHYKVITESMRAFHVASMHLRLERSSTFSSHSITLGGGFVRNDVMAVLDGAGIDCTINGLYLVDGQRLVDNHTTIDHAKPHCSSHELYKGILDGKGRAVFNGKIIVRPDAQKTDAKQTNKALLLSEDGQINTKPQLEIFADDVKCTHGATVGQLDEDALFYLRARGIARAEARNMLIHAFASDVLNRVRIPELREQLEEALTEQLPSSSSQATV